jgi:hypothetical protein
VHKSLNLGKTQFVIDNGTFGPDLDKTRGPNSLIFTTKLSKAVVLTISVALESTISVVHNKLSIFSRYCHAFDYLHLFGFRFQSIFERGQPPPALGYS